MTCTKKISTLIIFLLMPVWVNAAEFHVSKSWELFLALKTAAENDTDDSIFLGKGTYSGASFVYKRDNSNSLSIQAEEGVSAEQVIIEELTIDINIVELDDPVYINFKSEFVLERLTLIHSQLKIRFAKNIIIQGCHLIRSYPFFLESLKSLYFINNVYTSKYYTEKTHYLIGYEFTKIQNNLFHKGDNLQFMIISKDIQINSNVFLPDDYWKYHKHLKFKCHAYNILESGAFEKINANIHIFNNTITHFKGKNIIDYITLDNGSHVMASNNIIHGTDLTTNYDDIVSLNKTHFVDPENGDFHLKPTSSYIDAGSNENIAYTETDLDGNPRIANGIVDMGAYEFNTNRTHPADTNQNWVIEADEFSAYNNAWKNAENWPIEPAVIPSEYLTRCGFLLKKGGRYKDVGLNRPLCWMPDN